MLILQDISYSHPNRDQLFDNIHLTVNDREKIALIGNNGSGKSTLLKMIAGELQPATGIITVKERYYYVPQHFGQYNHFTVAQALGIDRKLTALKEILAGKVTEEAYARLDDDWTVEERCHAAMEYWQLADIDLHQRLETLSGGQKTKIFLAGIAIHQPGLILLDEPSNHLDSSGRQLLYNFVQSIQSSLIVVSHDRKLLNLLDTVCALGQHGITVYGGNYDFYLEQKQLELNALTLDVQSKEKQLRKAKEKERETMERQQRSGSRGKGKQEKAGLAKIMMNTLRNKAENSTARLKNVHGEKISALSRDLKELRSVLPDVDQMKFSFDHSELHKGKLLFSAQQINYRYGDQPLWATNLDLEIRSGERIALKGNNGSGKTTLVQLILGYKEPFAGKRYRALTKPVYIDQDYSLIKDHLSVYEQAAVFNVTSLHDHELRIMLTRFLFTRPDWDKPCHALSGGEKMRLLLCCLAIQHKSPDLIILDEPTNNLDLQNVEILAQAINEYQGTLIVVSHDEIFLESLNLDRSIFL